MTEEYCRIDGKNRAVGDSGLCSHHGGLSIGNKVTKPEHETKYLEFWHVKTYNKTRKWEIVSKTGHNLGYIKWFARWRQYCFFPYESTVFNRQCMRDINVFIESQMNARKK